MSESPVKRGRPAGQVFELEVAVISFKATCGDCVMW